MRVADYIFRFLADRGTELVFLVTGGGAMHLNDALGREKRLRYVCNLHEQACTMGAEGYARISGMPGVACVTTGPGGTNAITGVMGAWVDSIPMIVISGQVKRETTVAACPGTGLRQLGDQEINILDIVRPITKYAVSIDCPEQVREIMERAWHECRSGRPGPVWIDIPLDVQAAGIDPDALRSAFTPSAPAEATEEELAETVERLKQAVRPVIIAGNGVRLAGAAGRFRELAEQLRIPVLTSISGADLVETEFPYFFGRPGILGARAANLILQNADLLLVLGTRMSIRIIGYAFDTVARGAFRIMVDADPAELRKPTFRADLPIHADAGRFLDALATRLPGQEERPGWLAYCRDMRTRYPAVLPKHRERTDYVSSYYLAELIGRACRGGETVVTGNGTAYTSTFQAIPLNRGVRLFANVGCASMGYDLPAAIGAALASGGGQVVCLTGDGSIQMNLQELQTLVNCRLPVKLFVLNNHGYLSIKLTQKAFFDGNFVGSTPETGVALPDLLKLADAYGIPSFRIRNNAEAEKLVPELLAREGALFCEVLADPLEELEPKAASARLPDGRMVSRPLEDLAPFLPREELAEHMFIPMVEE